MKNPKIESQTPLQGVCTRRIRQKDMFPNASHDILKSGKITVEIKHFLSLKSYICQENKEKISKAPNPICLEQIDSSHKISK
jgi:hypothetical protein